MSIVTDGERERITKRLNRVIAADTVLTIALSILGAIAFEIAPSRVLQVICFVTGGIVLALFGWGVLLVHRLTGRWAPRMRSMVLTGEGVPSTRPLPLEEPLAAVADLLTSCVPFAPRVDLIARPSGLVFIRRRLGRNSLRSAVRTSRRRIRKEALATLRDLLDLDEWNRFVPWAEIRQVRIPGALPLKRVRFEFIDGSKLILWAWDDKDVELERALSKVLRVPILPGSS